MATQAAEEVREAFQETYDPSLGPDVHDDRTPEQKQTHTWAVVGSDSFLSGWGGARGRVSYAAWACRFDDLAEVQDRIERRSDMKRVRVVDLRTYRVRGNVHLHVYVWEG